MENNLLNEINMENNIELVEKQNNFLETTLGKTINTGIDLGIRALLPDFLENQVIDLKNNLLDYGLIDGIKKTVNDTINFGKNAIGLISGKFESINQVEQVIKTGQLVENTSNLLSDIIDKVNKNGRINNNIASLLKQGKNVILSNIEKNIENTINNQVKTINNTEKYISDWKDYFNKQDFNGMEKEFKKIENGMDKLLPLEKIINDIRTIENLHNLIKNNGKNFNLTNEELELAEKLF